MGNQHKKLHCDDDDDDGDENWIGFEQSSKSINLMS